MGRRLRRSANFHLLVNRRKQVPVALYYTHQYGREGEEEKHQHPLKTEHTGKLALTP